MAESTVRWFILREKHYWMATDSADPAKRNTYNVLVCARGHAIIHLGALY
jgi:hypothetical protein